MPTPVRPDVLKKYLKNSNYCKKKTQFLWEGFSTGFRLKHWSEPCVIAEKNAKSINKNEDVVWEKILQEITLGRVAGPFEEPPFAPFQVSPLDVREKRTPGKFRLIHNLSYPYDHTSVNSCIADNDKTVAYANICDAVRLLTLS